MTLYSRFRKYFGYMNTGHQDQRHDIFGYNGGLFAPDPVLDAADLAVDDAVLFNGAWALKRYDFVTEVDVNILGHIFEHSLNEIEEVQAQLEGRPLDKSKTKRKKDGVFYTPKYITRYIIENTVGTLCRQKEIELGLREEDYVKVVITGKPKSKSFIDGTQKKKELLDRLQAYQQWLESITILDPACGSGAFLNQSFNFLIEEHARLDRLRAKLFGDALVLRDADLSILENNLFGVDLNEEAVEIAQLSLWLRTAKRGRKLSVLSRHLRVGNSLISDPAVAGDKAFDWQAAFPQVFAKGGFDVVVGNPPYGILISREEENYYKNHFSLASYKTNLYVLFIERTFQIFKNSLVSFIIPKSMLINSFYSTLRKHLIERSKIQEFFTISEKVFEDAEVGGSLILTYHVSDEMDNLNSTTNLISTQSFADFPGKAVVGKIRQGEFLNFKNFEISLTSDLGAVVREKINRFKGISDYYNLKNGLNPGNIKHILIGQDKKSEKYKPIIWGKDISRYNIQWSEDFINYDSEIGKLVKLDDIRSKEGMNAQSKIDFALRNPEMFENRKIVVRKTGDSLIAALDDNHFYFDTLVHGIYPKTEEHPLEFLIGILNSKPATFFYRLLHDIQGKVFAKVSLDNLSSFPIPPIEKPIYIKERSEIITFTKLLTAANQRLHALTTRFLNLLLAKYPTLTTTRKLEQWPDFAAADFLKEIKKQKIAWSLREEAEWMEYLAAEQATARTLQQQIAATDRAIDELVYTLYGLTPEEVALVEGKG